MFDEPDVIARKVRRAVTDTDGEVRYDPEHKPGLANLLALLAVATDRTPAEVAESFTTYGQLKEAVTQALVEMLRPVRERRLALARDPGAVATLLEKGADRARAVASDTYRRAAEAMGLLGPGQGPPAG
jgi:tryptophanyl-tRNA synthetase